MGLASLRFCVSGAAPLRRDTEEMFERISLPLLQGYGMTEASPVISVNPLGKVGSGSVGPALPGIEVTIDEPNEEGIGEIVVQGPNVMREYYKNPEATRDVLRDGKLYTGDLGIIDRNGYVTIVGRKKSLIVTAGGKNVYPDEIEHLLNQSPFVLESIVLAHEDKRGNSRIGAIIVPDYDALGMSAEVREDATEERIKAILSAEIQRICSGLPDFKRILDFRIRDGELPKTTTQKVKRHLVTWIEE
jgi:long-chain acyl-CoA synthetase